MALALLGMLCVAMGRVSPAAACGGSAQAPVDAALVPGSAHINSWLWGDWEGPPPLTRFLYAVHPTDPDTYAALEIALYGQELLRGGRPTRKPSLEAFGQALHAGDHTGASRAAWRTLEQILDLPVPLATPYGAMLSEVVEYLELAPLLSVVPPAELAAYFPSGGADSSGDAGSSRRGVLLDAAEVRGLAPDRAQALLEQKPDHPRAASLRWLRLRAHIATEIADGWDAADIRAHTAPGAADRLLAEADGWLGDYPEHPLAEYVKLKKVRIHYLVGDPEAAWALLLELYPRHPARIANEMRFLIAAGTEPPETDLTALRPELASALLPYVTLAPPVWSSLWRRAEAEPEAPWSLPLRERLLWQLHTTETRVLPEAFPQQASAPTPSYARLRLAALLSAGAWDPAWEQSELMLADTSFVAPIRAQLRLQSGDMLGALLEPGLEPRAQLYLLRTLAPDRVLRSLRNHDDEELRFQSRLILALRLRERARGWYRGARMLESVDPERSALWREGARLSARSTPDAQLQYARWLKTHAGEVFLPRDHTEIVWYRNLPLTGPTPSSPPDRAPNLPFTLADEWAGTERWLRQAFATWAALQAYAHWLDHAAGREDPALVRKVIREADECYNALLNYGSYDSYAWASVVVDSDAARTIRRVGHAYPRADAL